jgi:hypothetical protein
MDFINKTSHVSISIYSSADQEFKKLSYSGEDSDATIICNIVSLPTFVDWGHKRSVKNQAKRKRNEDAQFLRIEGRILSGPGLLFASKSSSA